MSRGEHVLNDQVLPEFIVCADEVASITRDLPVRRKRKVDVAVSAEDHPTRGESERSEVPARGAINVSSCAVSLTLDDPAANAIAIVWVDVESPQHEKEVLAARLLANRLVRSGDHRESVR